MMNLEPGMEILHSRGCSARLFAREMYVHFSPLISASHTHGPPSFMHKGRISLSLAVYAILIFSSVGAAWNSGIKAMPKVHPSESRAQVYPLLPPLSAPARPAEIKAQTQKAPPRYRQTFEVMPWYGKNPELIKLPPRFDAKVKEYTIQPNKVSICTRVRFKLEPFKATLNCCGASKKDSSKTKYAHALSYISQSQARTRTLLVHATQPDTLLDVDFFENEIMMVMKDFHRALREAHPFLIMTGAPVGEYASTRWNDAPDDRHMLVSVMDLLLNHNCPAAALYWLDKHLDRVKHFFEWWKDGNTANDNLVFKAVLFGLNMATVAGQYVYSSLS